MSWVGEHLRCSHGFSASYASVNNYTQIYVFTEI
jgi:hypothetical protein